MHWGLNFFATEYAMAPDTLAREVESRGFESLWIAEHLHMPVERSVGHDLSRDYWWCYEPFLALTAAATSTERLVLGTGIALLIQRDPIHTAKQVATLDRLCGGRFIFGIGAGWIPEEIENHGVDFKTRFSLLRDHVRAMKAIWSEDEAEHHGRFVDFDRILSYPKPVQKPHPPVHMGGGTGPRVLECVLDVCDGWLPFGGDAWPAVRSALKSLRERAVEMGRDPAAIEISVCVGEVPAEETLEEMRTDGVRRVILDLPSLGNDDMLRKLDELTAGIADL